MAKRSVPTASVAAGAASDGTGLVGRAQELACLADALAHARLVTVTGPGGVGKSRLVHEVVTRVADGSFGAGVSFDAVVLVELEAVSDPGLVAGMVAAALGEHGACPAESSMVRAVAGRTTLLVLDGCDGLADGVGILVESVLGSCPGLRVLVTCQQVLHVGGEHVLRLGPLAVPPDLPSGVDALLGYEAVELFVAFARRTCCDLVLDDAALGAVARICRHLGGLPLALELVAPRLRALPLDQLADALQAETAGAELPVGGSSQRHNLDRTLAWTLRSLSDGERRALELLSVFPGGAVVEAMFAVLGAVGGGRGELVVALCGLVDKSIVATGGAGGVARFDLVGAVRGRVRADLARTGRLRSLARRQLHWCSGLAAGAEEALVTGSGQARWLELLAGEEVNLRAGLRFALDVGDADAAASLGRGLWRFWELRGQLTEGRHWLEQVLAVETVPAGSRAHLLDGMGMLAWRQGDYRAADGALQQALVLAERSGAPRLAARVVNHIGMEDLFGGKVAEAGVLC